MRHRAWSLLCFVLLCRLAAAAAEPSGREVLEAMRKMRINPAQVYQVRELNLYREELRLYLLEGVLAFLEPVQGQVTGAVFVGQGEVLLIPPNAVERRTIANFTKSPVLDERFSSTLLRFTDNTYTELREAVRKCESCEAIEDPELIHNWNPVVANMAGVNELRILTDLLSAKPVPFFAVRVSGDRLGVFDIVVDYRHTEQLMAGQASVRDEKVYNNLWCSFTVRSARNREPQPDVVAATRFQIESRILPSRVMQVKAEVELTPSVSGERVLAFVLSRYLKVASVQLLQPGSPPLDVDFYQNALIEEHQLQERGNDQVTVVLPAATLVNKPFALRFVYEGEVISDAGNGVMYVGARGSWYPHRGFEPARFDLTFYCPRRQTLVATGDRLEEREDGEWRISRWTSPVPVRMAGFNLGEYEKGQARSGNLEVEVYANRNLEPELERRRERNVIVGPPPTGAKGNPNVPTVIAIPSSLPSPVEIAARIARDSAQNLDFYTRAFGPLPLHRVAVSPIPGTFGQGWPGLVYVSTRSFMTPFEDGPADPRLTPTDEIYLRTILRSHELAHQWWGNLVAPASYRDEWLIEALSNYSALMYLATLRGGERDVRILLDRYRDDLVQKVDNQPFEQAGPPVLGQRLNSSQRPRGVNVIMYEKGTWIMHMLRQLMRDPKTGSDARFQSFLRTLYENYNQKTLTTEQFRQVAERFVIPAVNLENRASLEWFFDQWIYGVGIPEVRVKSSIEKKTEKKGAKASVTFQVKGSITLSGVEEGFGVPVPIYAQTLRGQTLLGVVSAIGPETSFSFTPPVQPLKVTADPQNALLALMK